MGVITILEGTSQEMVEWERRLKISRADVLSLIEAKILRADPDGLSFRLVFVGIVVFTDSLLFALPKFGDVRPIGLTELLRILRTYFARSGLRKPLTDTTRDPEFGDGEVLREFDAMLGLRDWYFAHGVYRRDRGRVGEHGRPHWGKTIAKRDPLLVQGSAVYPSVIAERREGVLDDISALQLGVLRHLLERYGFDVPASLVHAEEATGTSIFEWPLSDNQRSYHLRRLLTEQRSAFRTDILQLFRLLRESLDSRLAGPMPRMQIFGTTAFYAVWEDACRVAFDGDAYPEPASLVGQPVWWVLDSIGAKVKYEAAQIPDIIIVRGDWHIVVDAKYYYRFPQAHPGGPDIIKQFYYMESLRASGGHVLSVFLLPLPGASAPQFLGYATIEGAYRAFDPIEAWGVDPALVLMMYSSYSTHGTHQWIDSILGQRKRVAEVVGQSPA